MEEWIDLRSDTVTQPTQAMREAIYRAQVGDDIMGEDVTVRALEKKSAELLGKEDAVFVASGTMGNQIAVMAMTNRGEEVIVGDTSHIYNLESGGMAALSQVQVRPIAVPHGVYDLGQLEDMIQEKGIQRAVTSLICVENTNDLNAGLVVPQSNLDKVYELAKERNVHVHLDGARIFNAAVKSGVPLSRICHGADTVMFALTKGLAAPFGGILAGDREMIAKSRWLKQRIGGGFRQAGFMAAAGIVALDTMMGRISEDHDNAWFLGQELVKIKGLRVDTSKIHTSIVVATLEGLPITLDELIERLLEHHIKVKKISKDSFRMIAHHGIEKAHLQTVISSLQQITSSL